MFHLKRFQTTNPWIGDYGFVLPPEQIRGSAEEQWAGMQVMLSLLDEVFFDGQGPVWSRALIFLPMVQPHLTWQATLHGSLISSLWRFSWCFVVKDSSGSSLSISLRYYCFEIRMDPNGRYVRTLTHFNIMYGFECTFISAQFNLPSLGKRLLLARVLSGTNLSCFNAKYFA